MRHRFMLIGALLVALLALAACGGPAAEEEAPMAEAPAADMSDSPYAPIHRRDEGGVVIQGRESAPGFGDNGFHARKQP